MASTESQQDTKFKGHVSASIRDSIDKATGVLSQLHRVQSYLDVLRSLSPARGGGAAAEGTKSALELIRGIRTDVAALLQTVYLTEISLLSMQEVGGAGAGLASLMPLFGESPNSSGLSAINSSTVVVEGDGDGGVGEEGAGPVMVDLADGINFASADETVPPPAKKPSMGVVIVSCSTCYRKFATQRSAAGQGMLCRNCRSGGGADSAPGEGQLAITHATSTPISTHALSKTVVGFHNTTPLKSTTVAGGTRGGKGRKRCSQPPVSCKVCGLTFVYRRCIFRHLREVHSIRDATEIYQYIGIGNEEGRGELEEEGVGSGGVDGSIGGLGTESSLNVTVGSEVDPMARDGMELDAAGEGAGEEGQIITSSVAMDDMDLLESLARRNMEEEEEEEEEGEGGEGGGGVGLEGSQGEPASTVMFTDGKTFQCEVCNKVFDRPYRLQRHMQIHNPNRRRVCCQICDRMFTREDTLQNHMRCLHSDERPYKCSEEGCYKAFASQSALIQHLKSHMGGKPYKCNECSASFALLNVYKQHMHDEHADTEALRCSDCYRVFPDRDGLEQHKLLEHRYECEICGKAFARLAYLEQHARVHEGSGLFNCKMCNVGFDTEYSYKQHIRTHPTRSAAGTKGKTLQCPVCSVTFQHQSNLLSHLGSQEHRDKAAALGLSLNTIEGDLSPEVSALVDEVSMSEESLLQSISEGEQFQGQATSEGGFVDGSVGNTLQSIASQQTM